MNHSDHTMGMSDNAAHVGQGDMMNHMSQDGHHMDRDIPSQMGHDAHMGHGAHNVHMGSHMEMMVFHFGYNEVILFEFWKISSVEGLIASMVGIFFLAIFYEGLKYFREFLFWKNYSSLQYRTVQGPNGKQTSDETRPRVVNLVPEVGHRLMPTLCSMHHLFQTFLHIIQVFVSYVLMLIFMTFNGWLCIAVVLGAAGGYFLFGWKKALFVDVTEHCH